MVSVVCMRQTGLAHSGAPGAQRSTGQRMEAKALPLNNQATASFYRPKISCILLIWYFQAIYKPEFL
jgi:hypothetical protein